MKAKIEKLIDDCEEEIVKIIENALGDQFIVTVSLVIDHIQIQRGGTKIFKN